MRRLAVIFIFLLLIIDVRAATYYVSQTGNNAAAGGFATPWATWGKAFQTATAGDTVFFRGGVYDASISPGYGGISNNGTAENPICFFAYPPDWVAGNYPILDFSNVVPGNYTYAVQSNGRDHLRFKGLTVRNLYQRSGVIMTAFMIYIAEDIEIEDCIVHGLGGPGFTVAGSTDVLIKNCDAYDLCDSLSTNPGQNSDGFQIWTDQQTYGTGMYSAVVTVEGCRVWDFGDNGFTCIGVGTMTFRDCWAYNGGRLAGEGCGFKYGWQDRGDGITNPSRRIVNCISANNGYYGFGPNNQGGTAFISHIYNCFSYHNGYKHDLTNWTSDYGIGWRYVGTLPIEGELLANNIAYDNENADVNYLPGFISQYCSWTTPPGLTVSDDDFISLDASQLILPRKADNSLPDIDFGKLAPTSPLIDAGMDVGLSYYGTAPDLGWAEYTPGPQIIADHSIVDDYEHIPQYYIDSVKKMWLSYAGESHSQAIRSGLAALETVEATYAVNVTESGTPESYTDDYLRVSRATWGDYNNASGWIYGYGEEDWFTSSQAISRTKAGLTYATNNGFDLSVLGFGWCWDTSIDSPSEFLTYIEATKDYIDYIADSIPAKVIFTTGTTDIYDGETGYNKYLGYEQIRDSVLADTTRILFDYADILAYDDDGDSTTTTWDGHTYPWITPTNLSPEAYSSHISEAGALRLAKAMWWMLARIAGWDGNVTVYSEQEVDSTLTDILTFTLADQTAAATINTTNHTVSIEVDNTADITSLTPTITLSYGATVIPASGVARDFTNPVPYTVTAEDGVTYQEWTVTVTQAEEPAAPAWSSRIVKFRGAIMKL